MSPKRASTLPEGRGIAQWSVAGGRGKGDRRAYHGDHNAAELLEIHVIAEEEDSAREHDDGLDVAYHCVGQAAGHADDQEGRQTDEDAQDAAQEHEAHREGRPVVPQNRFYNTDAAAEVSDIVTPL